jgi:MFS family permease
MNTPAGSSRGRYLALLAALLGWMFDGMEMGLFPLVGNDALRELLGSGAAQSEVDLWYKIALACFLVGAATGGVVFGWLGDKIGRVRAMTISVFLYSLSSGFSAASSSSQQMAALRFLGALGMGGEWTLGVALVMEIWPDTSRAWLAGWIGAFGNLGYAICGSISYGLRQTTPAEVQSWMTGLGMPAGWAASLTANGDWRLLMLVGAVPALLTLFIRLFVPESEKWKREQRAGIPSRWSEWDLGGVLLGAAAACGVIVLWGPIGWVALTEQSFEKLRAANVPESVLTVIQPEKDLDLSRDELRQRISDVLRPDEQTKYGQKILDNASQHGLGLRVCGSLVGLVIVVFGYLTPVRGYMRRAGLSPEVRRETLRRMILAAGLSGVPLLGTWAGLMWMYQWVGKLPGLEPSQVPEAKAVLQIVSSIAAAVGCVIAAVLGGKLGRRPVYAGLCLLSLLAMAGFYRLNTRYDTTFLLSAAAMSFLSAAFYGWLPLYLPELFRTSVRATGQGFGFNFGRIIAAAGNLQMSNLLAFFDGDYAKACSVVAGVYIFGIVLIALSPETKDKPLPQ